MIVKRRELHLPALYMQVMNITLKAEKIVSGECCKNYQYKCLYQVVVDYIEMTNRRH